jgi:V-type H+-transporting ATPase subunit a
MYKEVNPAIFATVTFPFLFGVMFGDMGHGSLMLSVGIFLVFINNRLKGTALEAAG